MGQIQMILRLLLLKPNVFYFIYVIYVCFFNWLQTSNEFFISLKRIVLFIFFVFPSLLRNIILSASKVQGALNVARTFACYFGLHRFVYLSTIV